MTNTSPKLIIEKLELTLKKNNVGYEKIIEEFRQVASTEKRLRGGEFTLRDHICGLILAMLSNQRPWGQIAKNIDKIERIFFQYDPDKLQEANYEEILQRVIEIKCGNRSIGKQLGHLSYNIEQFKKIIRDFGSIDKFVSHKTGEEIATRLSDHKSPYKLKQIGFTLAMEYLRNVGVRGMKPDLHLLRICGSERLSIFPPRVSPEQATILFNEFSKQENMNPVYLDNLFWIFGAKDYANICSAKPKCNVCELVPYCNYPKNNPQ